MDRNKYFYTVLDSKDFLEATIPLQYEKDALLLRNLSCLLTLGGVSSFDISANPKSVKCVKEGIEDAFLLAKKLSKTIKFTPFIKISIGALNPMKEEFYCLGSNNGFFSEEFIRENLSFCIENGSEIIELHCGNMEDDHFLKIWEIINEISKDEPKSINLNRTFQSNAHLVNLVKKAYEKNLSKPILQIDGATSQGKGESYSDTIQSLATADILIKDLKIKEKKLFKKMHVIICGDVNTKTTALALICNIEYSGLSLGHHYMGSHFDFLSKELDQERLTKDVDKVRLLLPKTKELLTRYRALKK